MTRSPCQSSAPSSRGVSGGGGTGIRLRLMRRHIARPGLPLLTRRQSADDRGDDSHDEGYVEQHGRIRREADELVYRVRGHANETDDREDAEHHEGVFIAALRDPEPLRPVDFPD